MIAYKIIDAAIKKNKKLNIVIDDTHYIKMLDDGRLVVVYEENDKGCMSPLFSNEYIKKLIAADIIEEIEIKGTN